MTCPLDAVPGDPVDSDPWWLVGAATATAAAAAAEDRRTGMGGHETTDGAAMIAAERRRQIATEGWTADHDRQHVSGELVQAALYYADPEAGVLDWPWDNWPKTKGEDRVRDLVKAGALIAAEVDRLRGSA